MLKIFPKLLLLFSIIPYISSCAVTSSYYDMTEAEIEYNDCLNRFKKNTESCNNLKYDYQIESEDYAKDAEDYWEFFGLETEE